MLGMYCVPVAFERGGQKITQHFLESVVLFIIFGQIFISLHKMRQAANPVSLKKYTGNFCHVDTPEHVRI